MKTPLSTATTQVGDHFTATAVTPLRALDGRLIVSIGATLNGTVAQVEHEPPALLLSLDSVATSTGQAPIAARVVRTQGETYALGPPPFAPGHVPSSKPMIGAAPELPLGGAPAQGEYLIAELALPAGATLTLELTRPLMSPVPPPGSPPPSAPPGK
jgi:hypothetical protein